MTMPIAVAHPTECAPHRLPWVEVARGKNKLQMTKLTSELYVDGASWYARTTIFVASTLNLLDTKVNLTLKEGTENDTTTGTIIDAYETPGGSAKLTLPSGQVLDQINTILEYLVTESGQVESLLGATSIERAQVLQHLFHLQENLGRLHYYQTELNVVFQSTTFLVGDRLTLADLVLFWNMHPLISKIPSSRWGGSGAPKSLGRWYKSIEQSSLVRRSKVKPAIVTTRPAGAAAFPVPPSGAFTGEFGLNTKRGKGAERAEKAGGATKKAETKKKPAKAPKASKKAPPAPSAAAEQSPFTKIEIRIGKITKVWEHPDSEKLFCEEIDIGEAKVRSVASGLRPYYKLEDLQDRMVVLVSNLKAAKLGGFKSEGMVLCSKSGDKCEFLDPPAGAVIGERLMIDGLTGEPAKPNQVKKKKLWEAVAADLKTNSNRVACWQDKPLKCKNGGVCTTPSIPDALIS